MPFSLTVARSQTSAVPSRLVVIAMGRSSSVLQANAVTVRVSAGHFEAVTPLLMISIPAAATTPCPP